MLQTRRPHLAMQTIAPWVNFFVILPAGMQLPGAWRARAVSTTTSRARHTEMKRMLPMRIVFLVPKGDTGRQVRQGRPSTTHAVLVLAENTVKFLRRQVTNNALIAPPANTATNMRPAA